MAGKESNGFAPRVQPVHLFFVSIARSVPLRVAHPPPKVLSLESVPLRTSILDCIEEVFLNVPN